MATHKPGYIVLLVLSWLAYVAVIVFTLFADLDSRYFRTGLFRQTVWNFWNYRQTDITPASWIFNIWDLVLLYELIWLIYVTTTFGRKDGEDEYVYTVGPFINWAFYIFYILVKGVVIAALFMYDRNELIAAAILTSVAALFYTITLIIPTVGVFRYRPEMVNNGIPNEYKLVFGFVQNGIGLTTGWLTIQATILLSVLLQYHAQLPVTPYNVGSTIALVVFAVPFAAVAVLDLGILERYTRFLFTPYIIICYGLAGIMAKGYRANNSNSILLAALIALAGFLLILKIVLAIVRENRDPLFSVAKDIEQDDDSNYGSIVSEAESDTSKKSEISQASEKSEPSDADDRDYYND